MTVEVALDDRPAELAVEGLVVEHGRCVWRALLHFGVPARDVDDACQEVFVVAHKKLQQGVEPEKPRSWLYAIAARVASAHRRKAQHRLELTGLQLEEVAREQTPDSAVEDHRRLERLDAALDQLRDDQRVVFVLYEIEQLTMREVAETLNCSINTAFSRLYAARKRVAEHLGIVVPKEVWTR